MYLLSSSHIVLVLALDIQAFDIYSSGKETGFDYETNKLYVAEQFIEVTNVRLPINSSP